MHRTPDYTSLEVMGKENRRFGKLLPYGKAALQLCLPLGLEEPGKASDSRVSPSVEACTELEQAQLRQKLLS